MLIKESAHGSMFSSGYRVQEILDGHVDHVLKGLVEVVADPGDMERSLRINLQS